MEKQFVPYELALKLKYLGFNSGNEYCFGFYTEEYKKLVKGYNILPIDLPTNPFEAPLWQQAFDWFRSKYKFKVGIGINDKGLYYDYKIVLFDTTETYYKDCYKTYEEARLECLKKLIEIIENYE